MENQKITPNLSKYITASKREAQKEETENLSIMEINFEVSNEELLQAAIETFSGVLFGNEIFTNEEAEAYVVGENEIAELLREGKANRGFVETFLDPNKYEREIRKEYEKEHPEYAKAAKEGKKLQEEYDNARSITEQTWLENNPEPTEKYQKGNGIFGFSQTEEYKNWHNKKEDALNQFDKEYRYNNPDYDNLARAQLKNKSLIEIALSSL